MNISTLNNRERRMHQDILIKNTKYNKIT